MEVFGFFPYNKMGKKKKLFFKPISGFGFGFRSVFDVDNFRISSVLRTQDFGQAGKGFWFFRFFTVFQFLLELEILFLDQDFGFETRNRTRFSFFS